MDAQRPQQSSMVVRFRCRCCKRQLATRVWASSRVASARCCGIDWQATISDERTRIDEVRASLPEEGF
jgi:hypothetical protein